MVLEDYYREALYCDLHVAIDCLVSEWLNLLLLESGRFGLAVNNAASGLDTEQSSSGADSQMTLSARGSSKF